MTASVQHQVEQHLKEIAGLYREVNATRPFDQMLSEREMDIAVRYALTPMTAARIGELMFVSETTVKGLLRRAFTKLGIESRAELPAALANATVSRRVAA